MLVALAQHDYARYMPHGRRVVDPLVPPRPDRAELFAAETRPYFALEDAGAGSGYVRESGTRTVGRDEGVERWEVASLGLEYRVGDGVMLVVTRLPSARNLDDHHLRSDLAGRLGVAAAEAYEGEAYVDGPAMWARVEAATREAESWEPAEVTLDGEAAPGWRSSVGRSALTYVVPARGGVVFQLERGWDGPRSLKSSTSYTQLAPVPDTWT